MKDFKVTSLFDVVHPSLTGKTIVTDITKSFTTTNTVIGLTEAGVDMSDFWKRMKATKPIVMFRTEPRIQTVINCERPVDMFNLTGRIYQTSSRSRLSPRSSSPAISRKARSCSATRRA